MDEKYRIDLERLERGDAMVFGEARHVLRATFRLHDDLFSLEATLPVRCDLFDDADAVRIARNYFHWLAADLASQTADWALDDEWLRAHGIKAF